MSKNSKFLTARKPVADNRVDDAKEAVLDKKLKRLSLDLEEDLHKKLKLAALHKGVSMRELSIEALEKFLGC